MRGNTHVRFGGAGRGNGPSETTAPRPGPIPTDRVGTAVALDADHRNHAIVELAIRDLKEGAGWNHSPSGKFLANAAWVVIGALAHNLLRWVAALGLDLHGPVVAKTLRRRLITIPGRITRSARRDHLHLPRQWP
jgi:hypothetical protein